MKISEATALRLAETEFNEEDIRTEYSGRGMFGATCLAIVTDSAWELKTAITSMMEDAEEEGDDEEFMDLLEYMDTHEPRQDSMGLSEVFYWPGIEVAD